MQPGNDASTYFRKLYINTFDYVKNYMTASDQEIQNNDDPIMDIIATAPSDSLYFIEKVNLISALISVTTSFPFLTYIMISWEDCKPCNTLLRWWIIFNSFLQLLQAPVRFFIYFLLRKFKLQNERTHIHALRRLTSSKGWKLNKRFSLMNYMCFVAGIVVMITTKESSRNFQLWLISWTIILACVLRVLFTIIWFCLFFPYNHNFSFLKRGVPKKFFSKVKSIKYTNSIQLKNETCAICLSPFIEKEDLLVLVCEHNFHWKCAKKWLTHRRQCPLCLKDVTVSPKKTE